MQDLKDKTIKELAKDCRTVDDVHEMLKNLFRDTLQQILEAEMEEHLGYKKHSVEGINTGNSRNGYSKKTIKTRLGKTVVNVSRDRNGEFEPRIVRKYETTSSQLEEQIIAMYAKGMSTRDIEEHMRDIYGIDVSPAMVSKITDKILPMITEWQSRPLRHEFTRWFFSTPSILKYAKTAGLLNQGRLQRTGHQSGRPKRSPGYLGWGTDQRQFLAGCL